MVYKVLLQSKITLKSHCRSKENLLMFLPYFLMTPIQPSPEPIKHDPCSSLGLIVKFGESKSMVFNTSPWTVKKLLYLLKNLAFWFCVFLYMQSSKVKIVHFFQKTAKMGQVYIRCLVGIVAKEIIQWCLSLQW